MYLPVSPCISAQAGAPRARYISLYLHVAPCISLYLPISPHKVTARRKGLPLDTMEISTDVTQLEPAAVAAQPEDGTYVHGFLMEGARWDRTRGVISDSVPKVLHDPMPVIHVRGVTADEKDTSGAYICPVYTTTIRGPTFTFSAPMRSDRPAHVWVLAAVCLVMQPDQ